MYVPGVVFEGVTSGPDIGAKSGGSPTTAAEGLEPLPFMSIGLSQNASKSKLARKNASRNIRLHCRIIQGINKNHHGAQRHHLWGRK